MDIYKKILLILILLLVLIICYRFYKNYIKLSEIFSNKETFVFDTKDNEYEVVSNSDITTSVQNSNHDNIKLSQMVIKSAYNCAFTGTYMNLDMLKYVLSRGCRYLDFEVFYLKENDVFIPVVACSNDSTFGTIKSENYILLDDIFITINSNAFSFTSPNRSDPLIINLRIKSNDSNVYASVAKSIDYHLKSKLFDGKIHNDTLMKDVKGKIILSVDKTIHRNYKDFNDCNDPDKKCIKLKHFVNLESGGELLNIFKYNEIFEQESISILINNDNINTNVNHMKLVVPDTFNDNIKNPNLSDLILKYGVQISPFCFYKNDLQLNNYEEFFNDNYASFIPLGVALSYFKKLKELDSD
jgi:hypothetical protein|tara:strand:+ start:110 stop:1177 length:1068 start_codon:yes stop_codon:yes gene_type:complete